VTHEFETLRWPTNLDHAAIVERLVSVRTAAHAAGLAEFAARFDGIESLPSGQIGARVIGALTWVQEQAEYRAYATELEMVAVNLKNL
jgi:hypothetical protein